MTSTAPRATMARPRSGRSHSARCVSSASWWRATGSTGPSRRRATTTIPPAPGRAVGDAGQRSRPQRALEVGGHEPGGHRHEPVQQRHQFGVVATTTVAPEHLDGIVDDILHVGGVTQRQGGELLDGDALAHQGAGGAEHVDGVGRESLVARFAGGDEQSGAHHEVDHELGHVGPGRERGPIEVGVGRVGVGQLGEQAVGRRGRQLADLGEGESALGQGPDLAEPLDVLGSVPGDTALTHRRIEQLAPVVVANGVDRHARALGQFPRRGSGWRRIPPPDCMSNHSRSDDSADDVTGAVTRPA